jgi:hypothetical protein
VQRTEPTVRVTGRTLGDGIPLAVQLPHLHHDVPWFVEGAELRLRFMQFSVYPRGGQEAGPAPLDPRVLIGRERARGRQGG